MVADAVEAIKIFFCYAHEDEALRDQLEKHLSPLRRLRQITGWFDRNIQAGTDWAHEIETRLDEASIILLLVSPDFIYSDYCYSVEMQRALDRQKAGRAHVLPIILRPVQWEETPIGELQVLPTGGKPITQWPDRDVAFLEVTQRIRELVRTLLRKQVLSRQETSILYPERANLSMQTRLVVSPQKSLIPPILPSEGESSSQSESSSPLTSSLSEQSSTSLVTLTHQIGKDFIPVAASSQSVHVLVEIRTTESVAQERLPLNVALVLNHSSSMKGVKLKHVKEVTKMIIDRLEVTDYISVVLFDDTSQVLVPSMPACDRHGMKAAIDRIRDTRSSATMSLGIVQGLKELRRWNLPNAVKRLILLTDGLTSLDSERCRHLAREAASAAITISPLGIGADRDQDLLNNIGQLSGGTPAEFIEDPSAIVSIFQRYLESPKGPVVRDAMLTLRLSGGVALSQMLKILPVFRELDPFDCSYEKVVVIPLGDLEKNTLQLVLIEVLVSPFSSALFSLAQAEVTYDVPSTGVIGEKVRHDIKVSSTMR